MLKKYLLVFIVAAVLVNLNPIKMQAASSPAPAAANQWSPIGPAGEITASVPALAIDPQTPSTIFAGTAYGVYRSLDSGDSWVSVGLWNTWIYALAVDPQDSSIVYAGTRGLGVYKSVDGGATWQPANRGIEDQKVYTLAINPNNPDILYMGGCSINTGLNESTDEWDPGAGQTSAGSNNPGGIFTGPPWGGGVFRSTDGGQNWTRINNGLTEDWVYALAIDPTNPAVIYAGTHTQGVFKSTNSGDSWNSSSPIDWLNGQIRAIAIDPQNNNEILAGTWHGGIIQTMNGGESWNQGDLVQYKIRTLAYGTGNVIYAGTWGNGIFRSTQRDYFGPYFISASNGLENPNVNFIAVNPGNPSVAYGGFDCCGTYKTTNRADSWSPARNGMVTMQVTSLLTKPGNPNILFAGTLGILGVYRSDNAGTSWYSLNNGLANINVHCMVINSAVPDQIFVGTDSGVFMSTNGGVNWSASANGLPQTSILTLAIYPGAIPILYAGTLNLGVYASLDGGASWNLTTLAGAQINTLLVDPRSGGTVYAGTELYGLFKSINFGVNWASVGQGLGTPTLRALAADPANPDIIYAGTAAGIFKSTNAALTWQSMGMGSYAVVAIVLDPATPTIVYASTSSNGFFRYDYNSSGWATINDGLTNPNITSMVMAAVPALALQTPVSGYPAPVTELTPVAEAPQAVASAYPAPAGEVGDSPVFEQPSLQAYPAPQPGLEHQPAVVRSAEVENPMYLPYLERLYMGNIYFPMIGHTVYPQASLLVGTLGGGVYRIVLNNNIISSANVGQVSSEGSTK